MPVRRTLPGLLIAWIALGGAAPAQALDGAALRAKLTRETAKLGPASGAHVVDLDAGTVLFSRRPDLALVPASNEKLFVTATALLTLGPDARLETRVVGQTVAGSGAAETVVVGNLYLVGAGDPSLSNADLAGLADRLVRGSGLTEVEGGVVGDESLLDARRGSVDSGFAADLDLGGQLGALVVGHGVTDRGGPAHVVAERLQRLLKARGVKFGRTARTGRKPADVGDRLATDRSPPMAELVRTTNRPSDNFYAELLLKVLGAEEGDAGTTAAGGAVVRRTVARLGLRPIIVDGSGLSRANRTNARQVVTLLRAMSRGDAATAWLGSMTVAGRNGTLRRRMRGTAAAGRCSGKTGTLRGVSALSGYCTTTSGRRVVFSFLENGVGFGAKAVEDRMVAALARYEG
ncbi:MAG: D-alanyl-D-alanine carboxypeptidase [uncultured Solirubrobacteraceae bacterium]|uniref:D-alanyl-D-alanine carboxypeptidase n=1 Tax=uncultured Solirubrobacteraceae bacterium TaxID=1162706 RepID=A0A6J4SKY8_9ACTN|nr:MAG: D-alanyl-D-alanine carboxypeptidase [uncultured Solirubrobacteraceae bacterium]